jgi:predicted PurR-regulated permease PerM
VGMPAPAPTPLQNFARPARFALAVAITPLADKVIQWTSERTGLKRPAAVFVLMAALAIATMSGLVGALTLLGGFAPLPPKP